MSSISDFDTSPMSHKSMKNNRLMWEFECRSCYGQFITIVPKGPARERTLTCVGCGSREIRRINIPKLADPYYGG